QAAAVLVTAPILERRMELRNQIAVRGVNFDAVEARRARAQRRRNVRGNSAANPLSAHLLRNDGLQRGLVDRMRDRRWCNRRLAADIHAGMPAAVAELDRCLGSGGVNRLDQTRQPGNEAVVVYSNFLPAMAPRALRRCHFHGDETDTAT